MWNCLKILINACKGFKTFIRDISQLNVHKKFFTEKIIEDNYKKLVNEFEECMHSLNLVQSRNELMDVKK